MLMTTLTLAALRALCVTQKTFDALRAEQDRGQGVGGSGANTSEPLGVRPYASPRPSGPL
jgi:hypothetical protein